MASCRGCGSTLNLNPYYDDSSSETHMFGRPAFYVCRECEVAPLLPIQRQIAMVKEQMEKLSEQVSDMRVKSGYADTEIEAFLWEALQKMADAEEILGNAWKAIVRLRGR